MDIILKSVASLLITLLSYCVLLVTKKISTLIKNKIKDQKVAFAMERLNQSVSESVIFTAQTFADDLKKQGAFDTPAKEKAFNMAFEKAKTLLSEDVKQIINTTLGDFEEIIKVKIENQVASRK